MSAEPKDVVAVQKIEGLIRERTAARKARNFSEANRILGELLAKGIVLTDGPKGTTWTQRRGAM